jgi:hypothetical protein
MTCMSISLWEELNQKFGEGISKSIEILKERDLENIPGARDRLIDKFSQLKTYLPKNNGEIMQKIIDNSIQRAFFPRTNKLPQAFTQILDSRTPEQDYIIQELINGFISSESKAFTESSEGPILDHLVEAFRKRKDFKIVDFQFYAMFGDANKPKKFLTERLHNVTEFLGLESEKVIRENVATGEDKEITYYYFPKEITNILEGRYIETLENGDKIITEKFDKMVFTAYFLAKLAISRTGLDKYKVNGISAIFALILIISFMPKLQLDEKSPLNRDPHYNPEMMSVIPKSWMTKDILSQLLPPLIQLISYRLGGMEWFEKIELTEKRIKLHLQAQFLLKDVNKWVLGNMCRVEIPIFVEISAILTEVMVGSERTEGE